MSIFRRLLRWLARPVDADTPMVKRMMVSDPAWYILYRKAPVRDAVLAFIERNPNHPDAITLRQTYGLP